jgi:hypothetical protein
MAADNKDDLRKKIEDQISKLSGKSAENYREQLKALNAVNASLDAYQSTLEDISDRIADQNQGFAGLLAELEGINDELEKGDKYIKNSTKSLSGLESIASKLKSDQRGYTDLNKKQLKQEQSKLKILQDQFKAAAETIKKRGAQTPQEHAIIAAYEEQNDVFQRTNNLLNDRLEEEEKYSKRLGVTGALLDGMSKIPIVGPLLETNEALDLAREKAKAGGNAFQVMGTGLASMGKSLLTSFSDPLVLIGLLVKGFKMFLDLGFKADTEITNMSKSMAVSQQEAAATRDRFVEIQNTGDSLFETTTNLVNAQLELADAMGATRGFTESQLKDQVLLTKQMGFQAEEAAGIQQLAMSNGMTAREVTGSVIKQTAALAKQTGVQLDNKKVIGEVAKVSGQLRLQYANNPKLIASAVVQTKKLGLTLEQAAKAANSLLDFESSIENELSAELLTGKSLNLERARGLALNGQSAEAAAEMAKQIGTAADFTNMNVIQQEALAKSVGMSADELADSLIAQENLAKLGSQTRQQVEEQIALAKKQGDMDKVRMLENSIGNEDDAKAALEKVSAQEKFNAAIEKLKAMLASIVEGPAAKFVDYLAKLLGDTNKLKAMLTTIKAVAFALAAAFAIMNPVAAAVGLAVAGTVYAMSSSSDSDTKKGNDIMSPPPSGGGYGKRTLFGPEGAIQLNDKDTVMAGTKLLSNKKSSNGGSIDMSSVVNAIYELRRDINALANRSIIVQIDGKNVTKAIYSDPNTVGDESRTKAYQIS